MGKLTKSLGVYLVFCALFAFVDFDWNAESESTAKASIYKQTFYMNRAQLQVYLEDLSTLDSASMLGGMSGKRIHGMEVSDIHDYANDIRLRNGRSAIDFPSKSITELAVDFVAVPFRLLWDRN